LSGTADTQRRFFSVLEGLRGVAAILVMLRHIAPYVYPIRFQESYLAVDLFFILSGAVIANSYERILLSGGMSFRVFVTLRLIRIIPLYLLGSAIGIVAMIADGSQALHKVMLFAVLGLVMMPCPLPGTVLYPLNHPAWSLFFEFVANFFYAKFIRNLSDKNIAIIIVLSFVLLLIGVFSFGMALDLGWTRRTFIFGVPRVMFSFFMGVLIYRCAIKESSIKIRLGARSAMAALICSVIVLAAPVGPIYESFYCVTAIVVVFPLLILLSIFVTVSGFLDKFMRILGELSFPLYVLHAPLFSIAAAIYGSFLERYLPFSGWLFSVLAISVSLLVHFCLDLPFRRFLRGVLIGPKNQMEGVLVADNSGRVS